ncbi:MAG TPA: DUF3570 domain-containing protein [Polyangiaceae bacterium]|jgi:hypothetical protein|nr:DUF3570 domain-containing protein [Polyangiaceae bacterium]
MTRRRAKLAVAALLAVAVSMLGVASDAHAAPDTTQNDEEVGVLVESVFEAEYPKKQYVEALEKLQLAANVCQEGSCSSKVRARVLVAVATVLAGGLEQKQDAVEVFRIARKEDPKVTLIKGFDKGPIKEAWDQAGGKSDGGPTPPVEVERKKYPGGMRAPAGWKSPEGYFYYREAQKAEDDRAWLLCAGYASDSIAAEDRVGTKFKRAGCLDHGGKWVQALADYEAVAKDAPGLGMRDTGKSAKERFDELSGKVPKLVLRPPPKVENLEVFVDDEPISADKLGGELWVDPGQRRVTAKGKIGDQSVSFERDVAVNEGSTTDVDIKLVPQSARVTDNRILKCLEQSKSREELADCIGQSAGREINVNMGTEVSGYVDSDHTYVMSPAIFATVSSPTAGWSIGGSFMVDVVTTASTDIVATASPRWTEVRYVPALNGSMKFGDWRVGVGGGLSLEPDYTSVGVGANVSVDALDKRLTPTLSYGFGYDVQGRSGTPAETFSTKIIQNSVDLSLSAVLDKATVFTSGITSIIQTGDTSKPYRYIPLFDQDVIPRIPNGLAKEEVDRVRNPERAIESLPTDRERFAVYGRVAHRFDDSTLRVDERLYLDSWLLLASTTDAQWLFDVGERFRVWPHLRFHAQKGVTFWSIAYPSELTPDGKLLLPTYRTGDRELGPLIGVYAGGGARVALGEEKNWGIELVSDAIYTRYLNHLFMLERWGYYGALKAEVDIE